MYRQAYSLSPVTHRYSIGCRRIAHHAEPDALLSCAQIHKWKSSIGVGRVYQRRFARCSPIDALKVCLSATRGKIPQNLRRRSTTRRCGAVGRRDLAANRPATTTALPPPRARADHHRPRARLGEGMRVAVSATGPTPPPPTGPYAHLPPSSLRGRRPTPLLPPPSAYSIGGGPPARLTTRGVGRSSCVSGSLRCPLLIQPPSSRAVAVCTGRSGGGVTHGPRGRAGGWAGVGGADRGVCRRRRRRAGARRRAATVDTRIAWELAGDAWERHPPPPPPSSPRWPPTLRPTRHTADPSLIVPSPPPHRPLARGGDGRAAADSLARARPPAAGAARGRGAGGVGGLVQRDRRGGKEPSVAHPGADDGRTAVPDAL